MRAVLFLLAGASAAPAAAQTLTQLAEARLRYEHAEQDGLPRDADALTARVRAGVRADAGPWSALAEAQGNLAIVGKYFDGLDGRTDRPLVADPQNIALYLAQLRYHRSALTVTGGRQRIALDDERFVGNIPFRNNAQTFDAARVEYAPVTGVKADVSYVWSVRTLWGIDGTAGRQQAVGGDNVLANVGWASPIGTLTGFGYWIDQDEAVVQGFRLSNRTFGARLAGTKTVGRAIIAYQASYARQTDYHRNPNDYAADYWLLDATVDLKGPKVGAGYEVFGADGGRPFTSFQTPLASNFKFNGWAERFTAKPADGLRDLYGTAGWGWAKLGRLNAVSVTATYHRFRGERIGRAYGNEIDLLAQAKIGKTTAGIRYADYQAKGFATDTRKLWLQLDWTI